MTDKTQQPRLSERMKHLLGLQAAESLKSPQRLKFFNKSLTMSADKMGGVDKITDEQILGAYKIAHEAWPIEGEALAKAFAKEED